MDRYTVYALKTDCDQNHIWKPKLFESLNCGIARYGWSWFDGSDLRRIRSIFDAHGWDALSEDQKAVWRVGFLLQVKPGDYLVYINLPRYGECSLARVVSQYDWGMDWEDFNHRILVDPRSVRTFDRNDCAVEPALSARLKLQGRWWTIYAHSEFQALLVALESRNTGKRRSMEDQRKLLNKDIGPLLDQVAQTMQRTHPGKDRESLVAGMIERVPWVTGVTPCRGSSDHGADIIFEYEFGPPLEGLQYTGRCAVQVKSYVGELGYQKAIADVRKAFAHDPSCTSGLIVSTALSMSEEFAEALEALRSESGRPVGVLLGEDLARFFLRYGRA